MKRPERPKYIETDADSYESMRSRDDEVYDDAIEDYATALESYATELEAQVEGMREQAIYLSQGCMSWGCRVKKPEGQGVNGPCQCLERLKGSLTSAPMLAALATPTKQGGEL